MHGREIKITDSKGILTKFLRKVKKQLISEFDSACNSAELHELLYKYKRKLKNGESLDEYLLIMK